MRAGPLLIAYAFVNAILYSSLLPLWEGFDEPFHFGYVQQLANWDSFPDARNARLSREVEQSILLAPASDIVKQNLHQVTTYSEFFSWPAARRADARHQLYGIHPDLRWQPSHFLNYEAQQAPLAYIVLALPERVLAGLSIPNRILALRILAGLAGALLLFVAAENLFRQLELGPSYVSSAMFCLLSSQMLWATLAHVANDWLAVPIAAWLLVFLIRYTRNPSPCAAFLTSVILCTGLLTKAYFLAFVPLVLAVCVWRRRWRELAITIGMIVILAGGWYGRNLARYGAITGMQESRAGVRVQTVIRSVPDVQWPAAIYSSAHQALWTGNNTFLSLSARTLDLLIGVWLAAMLLWAAIRHTSAEWITVWYGVSFAFALAYAGVVGYVYAKGGGEPSPWYTQVLLAPMLGLGYVGLSHWRRCGRILAAILVLLSGYLLIATYVVKLVPLYSGYHGRTSLVSVAHLYAERWAGLAADLGSVTLAPPGFILVLVGAIIVLTATQQVVLIRCLFGLDSEPTGE